MSRSFLVDSLISRPAGPGLGPGLGPGPLPPFQLPPYLWGLSAGSLQGLYGGVGVGPVSPAGPAPSSLCGVLRPVAARPGLHHPLAPTGKHLQFYCVQFCFEKYAKKG